MRVVSLVPAATEIAFAIGAGDLLVAATHDCDYPAAAARLPRVTSSEIAPGADSRAIDDAVRAAASRGESTFHLDEHLVAAAEPDLILGQTLCAVCAVSLDRLPRPAAPAVALEAASLAGLMKDIARVGAALGRESEAAALVKQLRVRIAAVVERVRGTPRPRVACIEWLDPPFNGGHWVPEQVHVAGGIDVLGRPGERSRVIRWEEVRAATPEIVVLMPCGWSAERAAAEAQGKVPACGVPVWAVDGGSYFSRPGPRLVDGIELLAGLFHGGSPAGAIRVA